MKTQGRIVLLALVGIAATAAAYAAALSAMPLVEELAFREMLSHQTEFRLWQGVGAGSLVFLCCLFGGLIQAAILVRGGNARPMIAIATLVGSVGAWSLQVYAVAFRGVTDYAFGGTAGLTSPWRSFTAGEFVIFVTVGFVLVGVCQALTIRSLALAVFWPMVWLVGGLAFVIAISLRWPVAPPSNLPFDLVGSGVVFALGACVWLFVSFGIHVPWPRAFLAPMASGVASVLLVFLIISAGLRANSHPAPGAGISASIILQGCAAGKTFDLSAGQTVAIDLPTFGGIDTSTQWFDVGVSDTSVLVAAPAPEIVRGPYNPPDRVAIFRAQRTGVATIHAILKHCSGNFGGGCDRGYRWIVTIQVA